VLVLRLLVGRCRRLGHVLRRRRLVFVATDDLHAPEVLAEGPF
jgi:hypothetical protein